MQNEILRASLDPACIKLDLKANSRDDAIRELVYLVHSRHSLKNPEQILAKVLERENAMSTSLENGVACPHAKTDLVDRVIVGLGIKKSGIDFRSSDGQLSKIIILMVSPQATAGPHIRCLAEISKFLILEGNRRKVLEAGDTDSIYKLMTSSGA